MVIDKLVYIEGGEEVESVHVINFPVDRHIGREPREKMGPTNDGVRVDDTHVPHPLTSGLRLHDP